MDKVVILTVFTDAQPAFCSDFSAELETNINTVLCAIQALVKRREREQQQQEQHEGVRTGERAAHVPPDSLFSGLFSDFSVMNDKTAAFKLYG